MQRVSLTTLLTDSQTVVSGRLRFHQSGNTIATVWVNQEFQGTSNGIQRHYIGNAEIGLLMNPGEWIQAISSRGGDTGGSSTNFTNGTIIGYLVDANL